MKDIIFKDDKEYYLNFEVGDGNGRIYLIIGTKHPKLGTLEWSYFYIDDHKNVKWDHYSLCNNYNVRKFAEKIIKLKVYL